MQLKRILNPIQPILETKKRLNINTINTTFWEKLQNAFNVLSGDFVTNSKIKKIKHIGLFDYVTLFIPRLLEFASAKVIDSSYDKIWELYRSKQNLLLKILGISALGLGFVLSGLIYVPLMLTRNLIAGALTLVSSPIILLVDFISSKVKDFYEEKLLNKTVTVETIPSSQNESGTTEMQALGALLNNNGSNIAALNNGKLEDNKYIFNISTRQNAITVKFDARDPEIRSAVEILDLGNIISKSKVN